MHATRVAIEDLGWAEESKDSKERFSKRFRTTISGFPTLKFRSRAVMMLSRNGIVAIAVDPAYTSQWGAEHWMEFLGVTRHQAASLVIGRRAQGYRARRTVQPLARSESKASLGLGEEMPPGTKGLFQAC